MLLALWQGPATAEPKDGQIFEDWAVRCQKNPQNEAVEICTIAHASINSETKRPVMLINIGYVGEGGAPLGVITVPLLVRLPPGMTMEVDTGKSLSLPYEVCNPDGCQARFPIDADTLAALKKGNGGKVIVQVRTGQEIEVPFSLKGFTAALTALK